MQAIETPRVGLTPTTETRTLSGTKLSVILADMLVCGSGVAIAHAVSRTEMAGTLPATVVLLGFWAFWLSRARLYSIRFITRRSEEVRRIIDSGLRALASTALVCFLFHWNISRQFLILAAFLGTTALVAEREILRRRFNA